MLHKPKLFTVFVDKIVLCFLFKYSKYIYMENWKTEILLNQSKRGLYDCLYESTAFY